MIKVIILICSLATARDQCDETSAIDVIKPVIQGLTCPKKIEIKRTNEKEQVDANSPIYAGESVYAVIKCSLWRE